MPSQENQPSIKILIVEDQDILSETISRLINEEDDLEVVHQVKSGKEAISFLKDKTVEIDLVILDLKMEETDSPDLAGIKVARFIKDYNKKNSKNIYSLIMSYYQEGYLIDKAHELRVHGYLPKNCKLQELLDVIRLIVNKKNRYYEGEIKRVWNEYLDTLDDTTTPPDLTATQMEILQMVAIGMTAKEIAKERKKGVDGVEAHKRNLVRKFNAKNTAHMISRAHKWNFIKEAQL